MEKEIVEEIMKVRIKANEKNFTEEDLNFIYKHINVISKVYLLGILDSNIEKN